MTVIDPALTDDALRPWLIDAANFPAGGGMTDVHRFAVGYAVLAPSGHNSQPWRFVSTGPSLEVFADLSRVLPTVDPQLRELTMSCGAAIEHLRLAVAHFGYRTQLQLLPAPKDPALLARILFDGSASPGTDDELLFAQIVRRRTNRTAFRLRSLAPRLLALLDDDVSSRSAWLHVLTDTNERLPVTELVVRGDIAQMHDDAFRHELAAWMRSNRSQHGDGIRGYGLGYGALRSVIGPSVLRRFDVGDGVAASDRELATGSPALAVLGTVGDEPSDWIHAGMALARLLLRARAYDVWASFLNQPVEVEELRRELGHLIGHEDYPQLLLRLGHSDVVPRPEPRRPIDEVFSVG